MSASWQPSPRRRRRNLLLLVGLVPSLVAVCLALALLLMLNRQAAGVSAGRDGDHERSRVEFAANRWFGTVERWVAPFNEGVATFRAGRPEDALRDFLAALEVAPRDHQCLVLHNMAVASEALGDRVVSTDELAGLDLFRRSRATLAQGRCVQQEEQVGLAALSRELDEQLVTKIRNVIEQRDRRQLAMLELREKPARLDRQERLEEEAKEREQRLQDESEPPTGAGDGAGENDASIDYGW